MSVCLNLTMSMRPEPGALERTSWPSGTVTFLFTDIEGSTQRWEQHPAAMDAAVKRHDEIMQREIEKHHGYVFKTVGDAFCAVFSHADDAVAAAIAAQRQLAKEDFSAVEGVRVRMGIHSGWASERSGDYFGPDVNRVARLMSIGHGGQVLVSSSVQQAIEGDLPDEVLMIDLGLRRLKDLTQPEQVWQLTVAGLPAGFPPLNSLDARPNNLPVEITALLGREQDLDDLKKLIGKHRLVTITGSGGVGKTRIALQVGADLIDRFPDGVWFADLAPITDPELAASVVASALGMAQVEGRRVDESIPLWLKRKHLLLIMDNCEHLLGAGAVLADAIHRIAPQVYIVATSRQALSIAGEAAYRLPSLAVPTIGTAPRADEALQYGAIAVFVDRAALADARFALTDGNVAIVADICRRLDGIPLAIELAAARVKVLSIPNLAQRLNERFKLLTGGSRTALPRQKTLSALIDWSYDLLTPQEQLLFRRLAVFAGGFGLDAATTVSGGEGLDEIEILDLLASLTDKSLVVADTSGEQERYHLLESTRAYALEKLIASGHREGLARRHAEYFRDQAQAADERYGTGSTYAWLAQVELELDNYRAALEWALTQGHDAALGGAIAGALEMMWFRSGLTVEGRYWMVSALERVNESEQPRVVAHLLFALGYLSSGKRKYDAAERSARLFESLGDTHWAARARSQLAFALNQMGRLEEAGEENARALAAARVGGDKWVAATCLTQKASIEGDRGDLRAGRELYTQALAAFKALGDETGMAAVQGNMAELEFADGHPEQALRLESEALRIDSRGKNATNIANLHNNSAAYRIALEDFAGARGSAREGLRWARQAGAEQHIAVALQHLAVISRLDGDIRRAAQLLGYVDAQYKELGMEREATEKWGYEKLMAALREKLSEREIAKLAAEGGAWSEDQAVEEALKL